MSYTPPEGYEIRSITHSGDLSGSYVKVTPYYQGQPISEGKYPGIYGYGTAIRAAKRAIRIHRKNHVDSRLP